MGDDLRHADGARRPAIRGADRDRRRRRAQRDRAAAGTQSRLAAAAVALDMMEETPRTTLRDVDPSTLWVAYGFDPPRRKRRSVRIVRSGELAEGYAYIFPKRDHVNVGIGYVLDHYRGSIDAAPYELQRGFVDHLRRRGVMSRANRCAQNFTPFPDSGRRTARASRRRPRAAGGRRGRLRQRLHGRGHLLRDGVGRAGGAHRCRTRRRRRTHAWPTLYRRACDREIGAELRDSVLIQRYLFGDRRRIATVIDGASRAPAMTRADSRFRDRPAALCSTASSPAARCAAARGAAGLGAGERHRRVDEGFWPGRRERWTLKIWQALFSIGRSSICSGAPASARGPTSSTRIGRCRSTAPSTGS